MCCRALDKSPNGEADEISVNRGSEFGIMKRFQKSVFVKANIPAESPRPSVDPLLPQERISAVSQICNSSAIAYLASTLALHNFHYFSLV